MNMATHEDKVEAWRDLELALNVALIAWGDDDPTVRKILLKARGDLRMHLEGART